MFKDQWCGLVPGGWTDLLWLATTLWLIYRFANGS